MFSKGDMVVYPQHGAGVIEDLEEHCIDGLDCKFYVLNIPVGNLKIMVSVNNAEQIGIRRVLDTEAISKAICGVKAEPAKPHGNWSQRYQDNLRKIKSGNLSDAAYVFRYLRDREREHGLSIVEKKMLTNVKHIILSEIILSFGVQKDEAEVILEDGIDGS